MADELSIEREAPVVFTVKLRLRDGSSVIRSGFVDDGGVCLLDILEPCRVESALMAAPPGVIPVPSKTKRLSNLEGLNLIKGDVLRLAFKTRITVSYG